MKQLVYRSQPFGFDRAMLAGILLSARRNNRRDCITGALICRHDIYLQLIEGPAPAIDALYAKIVIDDRHSEVELLLTRLTDQRLFPHWEMLDDEAPSLFWSPGEVAEGAIEAAGSAELIDLFARLSAGARARNLYEMPITADGSGDEMVEHTKI